MGLKELTEALINPYVLAYVIISIIIQVYLRKRSHKKKKRIEDRRRKEGLPQNIMMDHSELLADLKKESIYESSLLLATILLVPFAIVGGIYVYGCFTNEAQPIDPYEQVKGLGLVFAGLLIWTLFNGTDIAKAFLGGLGFKTLVAFKSPFQVGDRVTLKGYSGKVVNINTFFITIQTPDDDLVSIPTGGLWSDVLISTNAGERSSLCVMKFHLAPFVTQEERQASEDAIWDSMQASLYIEISKPMQIFISQESNSIILTAKAYVASTYNEPLFKSDVTRAFLDFASNEDIPLASPSLRKYMTHKSCKKVQDSSA